VNRHLDFLPTLSLPGRGGGEAEARTAASSILLLASGGELLPTSEHRSFFPLKARILLCRGPVLWVLELPLELGFAGTCLDFFCAAVGIAFCAWLSLSLDSPVLAWIFFLAKDPKYRVVRVD
jgi:hypothetical protein